MPIPNKIEEEDEIPEKYLHHESNQKPRSRSGSISSQSSNRSSRSVLSIMLSKEDLNDFHSVEELNKLLL